MILLAFLGIIIIVISLIYLVIYFIKRKKNKALVFPKRNFYFALISGVALFFIGAAFDDGTAIRVIELEDENEILIEENEKIQDDFIKMENELNTEIETLDNENFSLKENVENLEEENTKLKENNEEIKNKLSELNAKIEKLEEENKNLKNQVNNEKEKAAAAKKNSSNSNNTSSSQSSSGRNNNSGNSSGSVHYQNCTEARNAGVTPIYKGEPGYAPHLDRDGDGIACE